MTYETERFVVAIPLGRYRRDADACVLAATWWAMATKAALLDRGYDAIEATFLEGYAGSGFGTQYPGAAAEDSLAVVWATGSRGPDDLVGFWRERVVDVATALREHLSLETISVSFTPATIIEIESPRQGEGS